MKKKITLTGILFAILILGSYSWAGEEVIISPGALEHFVLEGPKKAVAGKQFTLTVTAQDAFGNVITDYSLSGKGVEITTDGVGKISPDRVLPAQFKDGRAETLLTYDKAQDMVLICKGIEGRASGRSERITVLPAGLDHFVLTAPKEAVAGEPFDLWLSAQDAYRNTIPDYATLGKGVTISASGEGKISPNKATATQFINGVARVSLSYNKAQTITLSCKEEMGVTPPAKGESSLLTIKPASLDHFLLSTAPAATAGKKFQATITACDSFENIITDYGQKGQGVVLLTRGKGHLSPSSIPASQFQNGVANVELTYDKAEPITIEVKESTPVSKIPPKEARPLVTLPKVTILVAGEKILVERIDSANGWAYIGDEIRYVNIRIREDKADVWREVPRGRTPETYQAIQRLLRKREVE
ncbi:hypothetical protein L6386_07305 [bacterium]|nr:hypothetical protein [bacterium]